MTSTHKSKKKSKWYYRNCSQQTSTSSIALHSGLCGVLLTCNGNEGRAISEFYRLLDFTLDHLGISIATLSSTSKQKHLQLNTNCSLQNDSCSQSEKDSSSEESNLSTDETPTASAEPKRARLSPLVSSESVPISVTTPELDIAAAIQAEVDTLQPAAPTHVQKAKSERKPFEGRLYHQVFLLNFLRSLVHNYELNNVLHPLLYLTGQDSCEERGIRALL